MSFIFLPIVKNIWASAWLSSSCPKLNPLDPTIPYMGSKCYQLSKDQGTWSFTSKHIITSRATKRNKKCKIFSFIKKVTWSGAAIFRIFVILPFAAVLFRTWSLPLLVWRFLYIPKNKSWCLELYLKLTFLFFWYRSLF